LGLDVRGVQKHHKNIFAKSPCRKLFRENSQKTDKIFDISFSSTFFVLGASCDGSSKALQKTFFKQIVSKSFSKKSTKKPKTDFFSILFYHVFGRFSVRGVQKHDKQISKKNLTNPGTFLAPEEPTNHVKVRHFCF
jgi:hypothetical protein